MHFYRILMISTNFHHKNQFCKFFITNLFIEIYSPQTLNFIKLSPDFAQILTCLHHTLWLWHSSTTIIDFDILSPQNLFCHIYLSPLFKFKHSVTWKSDCDIFLLRIHCLKRIILYRMIIQIQQTNYFDHISPQISLYFHDELWFLLHFHQKLRLWFKS